MPAVDPLAAPSRMRIRLRPGKDLSIRDKLEVWTRQSAFADRDRSASNTYLPPRTLLAVVVIRSREGGHRSSGPQIACCTFGCGPTVDAI